jgi:ATP-dependent DNA helicase RecQ
MLYNGSDFQTWKFIIEKTESAEFDNYIRLLDQMYRYCSGVSCRHKSLVTYFGQDWTRESCGACDICSDTIDAVPDSTIIAQKIMSAVYRTGERFGAAYVCDVLIGSATERVLERGHDQIPTFGVLEGHAPTEIRTWIDQLIDQDMLAREGEYRVLKITDAGWQVLRSKAEARLLPVGKTSRPKRRKRSSRRETPPAPRPSHNPAIATDDDALFERLREFRRLIAEELKMPAFYVFSDKTLREIARTRPTSHDDLLALPGIGPAKLDAFGDRFLEFLRNQA